MRTGNSGSKQMQAVTKNLKDIQGPALSIVLERLKHSGTFQETFDVAKTISMGPSLKSGSKVRKSSSNGNGDRRAGNRAVSSVCSYPV
ncbi:hypothetical protein CsSME_00011180 [Camellia sinensis var. sinensis]